MNLPTQAFSTILTGEVQGGTTPAQLPNVAAAWINIKAESDNASSVFLTGSTAGSNATVADGTTDQLTGFELDAGQETGWIPLENLNKFWMVTNANGDDITYMILR